MAKGSLLVLALGLFLEIVATIEIHKEPLWPNGKKIVLPDPLDPNKSIVGIVERNPVSIKNPEAQILYYFFPSDDSDNPVQVDLEDMSKEILEKIDPNGVWVFGIHGFDGDYASGPIFSSTARDMQATRKTNVIQVDWRNLAAAPWYLTAKDNTKTVGMHVAHAIHNLVFRHLAQPEKIHIIGFSLGAHAAGHVGKTLTSKYRLIQHRITGLDPAGPGYEPETKENKLDSGDGRYVEVFHTCGGYLGTSTRGGHVDFYVNGGTPNQPGCSSAEALTLFSCSHQFALQIFSESINHTFSGKKCRNSKAIATASCDPSLICQVGFSEANCPPGAYYLPAMEAEPKENSGSTRPTDEETTGYDK